MLMKAKTVDFFYVASQHKAIDAALGNWADWVQVRQPTWISPMFRMARSNTRQWHAPDVRPTCDVLAAVDMEKAVYALPAMHREALRWCYVYKYKENLFRRKHGLTAEGLHQFLQEARTMLMNRQANTGRLLRDKQDGGVLICPA